jgi:molybdopterin molybdotransferase
VAVLATGDELVEVGEFAEVLAGRRIVNSNSHALAAGLRALGAMPQLLGIAADDAPSLRARLAEGLDADALIVTAGASVGDHDRVKDVLEELGVRTGFWRVRMRPGSPFGFGTLARGAAVLPVFSLPGNPVSAVVTFEVLVAPVLRRLLGCRAVYPRTLRVRAAEPIPSKRGLMHFLRVALEQDGSGTWLARLTGAQGSGMLTSLVRGDALLIVPETSDGVAAGEAAIALPLWGIREGQTAPRFEMTMEEE